MIGLHVFLLQPHRAQRRREREGHEHRDQDRGRRRDAEAVEVAADLAGHEGDRHEDHDQRERRRHDGHADLRRRFGCGLLRRHALFLDEPEDVLEHDDRIVDDDAGGQRQRQHRHVVQREAGHLHEDERPDDRGRHRQGGDQRHAQVADEEKDHHAREQTAEQEVTAKRLEGIADEARLVVPDADLEIRRQGRLDLFELGQDAVDDVDGIGARLLSDLQADGRLPVDLVGLADLLDAVLDVADVAKRDDRPVAVGQDDPVEIVDVLDPAERAERHFRRPGHEVAAGDLDVLTRDGGPHLIDGQPVGVEPVGVEQQLDLPPAIPLQLDRPHVFHRLEDLLDLLVRNLRDFLLRSRPVDVELQNRRRVRVLFLDLRRPGVARKLLDDGRDLVADVLRRGLDVALEGERDVHLPLALVGVRPQLVDPADRVDRFFDPLRDLGLDLLGARPGKLDLHVDDRLIGLRHQVETEIAVRERAEHDERGGHHDREDRTLDADVCQFH